MLEVPDFAAIISGDVEVECTDDYEALARERAALDVQRAETAVDELRTKAVWVTSEALTHPENAVAYALDAGDVYRVQAMAQLAPHGARKCGCRLLDARIVNEFLYGEEIVEIDLRAMKACVVSAEGREDIECVRIGGADELYSRNAGLLETDAMAQRTAMIVGLGSGGSPIAVDLAKAGVGKFVLIDNERLELGNVARHALDTRDLGRRKVWAVRDAVLARNPYAIVECFCWNILEKLPALEELVVEYKPDVLIAATDTGSSRSALNKLALDHDVVALFGRTVTRAAGGDVLRVKRGGPCVECFFGDGVSTGEVLVERNGIDVVAPRIVGLASDADAHAEAIQYATPAEAALVAKTPGLASDIAPISQFMTKLALLELSKKTDGCAGLSSLRADLDGPCDYWLWANRREADFDQLPPLGADISDFAVAQAQLELEQDLETCVPPPLSHCHALAPLMSALQHAPDLCFVNAPSLKPPFNYATLKLGHRLGFFDLQIRLAMPPDDAKVPSFANCVEATLTHAKDAHLSKLINLPVTRTKDSLLFDVPASVSAIRSAVLDLYTLYPNWKLPYAQTICRWYGILSPIQACSCCAPFRDT